jgi:hypothetical protein
MKGRDPPHAPPLVCLPPAFAKPWPRREVFLKPQAAFGFWARRPPWPPPRPSPAGAWAPCLASFSSWKHSRKPACLFSRRLCLPFGVPAPGAACLPKPGAACAFALVLCRLQEKPLLIKHNVAGCGCQRVCGGLSENFKNFLAFPHGWMWTVTRACALCQPARRTRGSFIQTRFPV